VPCWRFRRHSVYTAVSWKHVPLTVSFVISVLWLLAEHNKEQRLFSLGLRYDGEGNAGLIWLTVELILVILMYGFPDLRRASRLHSSYVA
jgi:hypothetical protein